MTAKRMARLRPLPQALVGAEREYAAELRRWYRRSGLTFKDLERLTHRSDSNWSRYLRGGRIDDEALRVLAQAARATRAEWMHVLALRRDAEAARESEPIRRSAAASQPAPAEWGCVEFDVTYRLRGREGFEAECVHTVRALADGVDGMNVITECKDGSGWLQVWEGGTIVDERQVGTSAFRAARIGYPRTLSAGDTHRLRYDVRYEGSEAADPYYTVRVARPTDHVTVRVTFDCRELPSLVWRVDGLLPEAFGGDPREAERLALDPQGHVGTSFDAPAASFCYGIAWEW